MAGRPAKPNELNLFVLQRNALGRKKGKADTNYLSCVPHISYTDFQSKRVASLARVAGGAAVLVHSASTGGD
jgi:hypothetical protein